MITWIRGAGAVVIATAAYCATSAEAGALCVNGHPAKRDTNITYGNAPQRYGLVRDHIIPLGLGGPDTANNIQYQTYDDAHRKDQVEWAAIEGYCAGAITLNQALEMVRNWRSK